MESLETLHSKSIHQNHINDRAISDTRVQTADAPHCTISEVCEGAAAQVYSPVIAVGRQPRPDCISE